MDVEIKLRELLVPVLGLESIEEIQPLQALVKDLGADSIDFVEIMYVVEQNFGVVLKTGEIIVGGVDPESLFADNVLTAEGARIINDNLPLARNPIRAGMTRYELFSGLTVRDLAGVINRKLKEKQAC